MDAVYAAFTAAHPNVTIEREVVTDQQMRQTVNTALASGTGPDVIYYAPGPGYAGVLAKAGLILPLDDLASSTAGTIASRRRRSSKPRSTACSTDCRWRST